jgi:hypothetical protein
MIVQADAISRGVGLLRHPARRAAATLCALPHIGIEANGAYMVLSAKNRTNP